jgi:hypothetical protein
MLRLPSAPSLAVASARQPRGRPRQVASLVVGRWWSVGQGAMLDRPEVWRSGAVLGASRPRGDHITRILSGPAVRRL